MFISKLRSVIEVYLLIFSNLWLILNRLQFWNLRNRVYNNHEISLLLLIPPVHYVLYL